jgi:hypothetical protein
MKKLLLIIGIAGALCPAFAQRAERTYVTTDRDWYAAGETVYLSAFCVDVSEGVCLSDLSAVAYVELTSADGLALGGKVALQGGRGAGSLELPRTLPTGNYRLSAYTALSGREGNYDPRVGSRIISVYNTLSTARVADAVEVGSAPSSKLDEQSGSLQVRTLPDGRIGLSCPASASLSVSVYRNEPFPSYGRGSLAQALSVPAGAFTKEVVPEFDGEILTLRITGADGQPLAGLQSPEVFVARPGHLEDVYTAQLQEDGKARFFTTNFFGSGDMVVSLGKDAPAFKVEVESPYRQLEPGSIPALVLDPSRSEAITRLGARMQVTSAFDADTLYQRLPARQIAFVSDKCTRYILDDYTRFATFREVFVEYLSDIRSRGRGEDLDLQVRSFKKEGSGQIFRDEPSLILVDGVPVFNHSLVYNLDPALVKSVEVYPYYTTFGHLMYSGVANFETFKGDLGGIRFGDNVRIIDFSGAAYPVAFTTPSEDLRYPSQRETLLWQPVVELRAGVELVLPALQAEEGLVLVAEGLTESGDPVLVSKVL